MSGGLSVDVKTKSYEGAAGAGRLLALRDVRFAVEPGEFVCLLGPSGCGKTTLLNLIAGLDRDFDGAVSLPHDPGGTPPRIGYVFQNPRLLPWRTVIENLHLVMTPQQIKSGIAESLLAEMGLAEFRDTHPQRLSVGMSRRVALARAFAIEPDLLLMDEPFVSVDEATAERLRQLLLRVWSARPTTVLFVTHDSREAVELGQRLLMFSSGPGTLERELTVPLSVTDRKNPQAIERFRQQTLNGAVA